MDCNVFSPDTCIHYRRGRLPQSVKRDIQEFDDLLFSGCENTHWRGVDWVVCYDDKKELIAYGGIEIIPSKRYSFLCRCGVREDWRGQGIQKELIRRRVEIARESNKLPVVTYTSAQSVASMNSLIACGFKTFIPVNRFAGEYFVYWQYAEKTKKGA